MKRIILIIISAVVALCMSSCVKQHDIKITSASVETITPSGFRGVNGVFRIGIHNPHFKFKVCDIHGTIFHKGSQLADFSADDIEIEKKSDKKYDVAGSAKLCDGVSLISVISQIRNLKAEEYTVDVYATVKAKGLHKSIERKGIPLTKFTKMSANN